MQILGRLGALILGALGVIIGFIVNLLVVFVRHVITGANSHGVVGLLMVLLGLLATIIVGIAPESAALLFLIAGVVFFWVAGLWALLVSPFFLLAAVLAYLDRRRVRA